MGKSDAEKAFESRISEYIQSGKDVNQFTERDLPILHWAVALGYYDATKTLLEKGADPNTKVGEKTMIYEPIFGHHLDHGELRQQRVAKTKALVELLLKHGADVNPESRINDKPLHKAASAGCPDLCELFIERGAQVNATTALGQSALHDAAKYGYWEVVKCLLNHGADARMTDKLGQTPLSLAEKREDEELSRETKNQEVDYDKTIGLLK